MVATKVLLLLHVPFAVTLVSCVVDPTHTSVVPNIGAGIEFTVTVNTAEQPAVVVTVAVVTPPGLGPANMVVFVPGPGITVATVVLLLLHMPVIGPLLSTWLVPAHIWLLPVIGAGSGFTVTVTV